MSISLATSSSQRVRELLANHPRVERVDTGTSAGIEFSQGAWKREIRVGDFDCELYGLVEFMDNNPLVCADRASIPGPAATLALIALAPLARAGLIADSPVLMLNFGGDEQEVGKALESVGWTAGLTIHTEEMDLGNALAATAMVSIRTPDDLEDVDALYEEQFGRSFYVQRDESSEWGPNVVLGKPFAAYRLRIVPDSPNSLLTVRLLSDRDGKCGASQIVHAMNVMCGFEESLGIK